VPRLVEALAGKEVVAAAAAMWVWTEQCTPCVSYRAVGRKSTTVTVLAGIHAAYENCAWERGPA